MAAKFNNWKEFFLNVKKLENIEISSFIKRLHT